MTDSRRTMLRRLGWIVSYICGILSAGFAAIAMFIDRPPSYGVTTRIINDLDRWAFVATVRHYREGWGPATSLNAPGRKSAAIAPGLSTTIVLESEGGAGLGAVILAGGRYGCQVIGEEEISETDGAEVNLSELHFHAEQPIVGMVPLIILSASGVLPLIAALAVLADLLEAGWRVHRATWIWSVVVWTSALWHLTDLSLAWALIA